MNFKDQWTTNDNGERFLFTVEMQRKLHQAGLPVEPSSLGELPHEPESRQPTSTPTHQSSSPPTQVEEITFTEPKTIQIDPQTGKYIGRMKWYNAKKGYGFLVRGAGEEIFFHKSGTVGDPTSFAEGQWVLYDVEDTRKGPEATEIEPYSGSNEVTA